MYSGIAITLIAFTYVFYYNRRKGKKGGFDRILETEDIKKGKRLDALNDIILALITSTQHDGDRANLETKWKTLERYSKGEKKEEKIGTHTEADPKEDMLHIV